MGTSRLDPRPPPEGKDLMTGSTLLKDVIDVPEYVAASDFVLELHHGVEAAERTLDDYIVTESIAKGFDEALGLITTATRKREPMGAFVHGSFGAGKSHFMAVLHLLLTGNTKARALPNLQGVVAKYEETLSKRFLAVDYHLIGKASIEEALFAGYLGTVARLHPDAAPPMLHRSDSLLANANQLRQQMGDEQFFAKLNGVGGGTSSVIPTLGRRAAEIAEAGIGSWDAVSFDAALHAAPTNAKRVALVRALMDVYFSSYTASGEWLEISAGLQVMTDHAKSLGYDGLILFLDELVLWLAQKLSNPEFIATEVSKVAKLVEAEMAAPSLPIISFVARQRDLKDFIGDAGVGGEKTGIAHNFGWFESRFDRITLAAADLPRIVHQRLLQPKDEAGKEKLGQALAMVRANRTAWSALLTDEANADEQAFRLVYPFSPALIDALVALSSLLQRERTALKVLSELLMRGRDELVTTDVIPVGDLFDVVVLEHKALAPEMEQRFEIARRFYRDKMRPLLLNEHGLSEDEASNLPRTHAFRAHDRLAKTLLVAEIAPEATSLKNLTAGRLAALNFGSVKAMLPGQETSQVLALVRGWARHFGEISIGSGADPIITLTLSGVDSESVVERVTAEDSPEERRRLIRDLLTEELGLPPQQGTLTDRPHTHIWRGSRRDVDVTFANVRDENVRVDQLRSTGGRWKLVIDYPFDDNDEYTPNDDFARIERLKSEGIVSDTVAWVPYFFTAERMKSVGRLVVLDYLLSGDRFEQNASHLPVLDRPQARRTLETQRASLRQDVLEALLQAYGVRAPKVSDVDAELSEHRIFASLRSGFEVSKPVAAGLREALGKVLDEALADQYPQHPTFEPSGSEVRRGEITTALAAVREAVGAPAGRIDGLERGRAATIRRVVTPLGLGESKENVYAISSSSFRWWSDLSQWAAAVAGAHGEVRVKDLRDKLAAYGMVRDVEDLLLLTWAALDDREFRRHSAPLPEPGIGALTDDIEMRPPVLPEEGDWAAAVARAGSLFGVRAEHRRSASAVARLATAIRESVTAATDPTAELLTSLRTHAQILGLDAVEPAPRLATAEKAGEVIGALSGRQADAALITALAGLDLPLEPQALAKSIASAGEVHRALGAVRWDEVSAASHLDGGAELLERLRTTARAEELHAQLIPVLADVTRRAQQLVLAELERSRVERERQEREQRAREEKERQEEHERPDPGTRGEDQATHPDEVHLDVDGGGRIDFGSVRRELERVARDNPDKRIRVTWSVE